MHMRARAEAMFLKHRPFKRVRRALQLMNIADWARLAAGILFKQSMMVIGRPFRVPPDEELGSWLEDSSDKSDNEEDDDDEPPTGYHPSWSAAH